MHAWQPRASEAAHAVAAAGQHAAGCAEGQPDVQHPPLTGLVWGGGRFGRLAQGGSWGGGRGCCRAPAQAQALVCACRGNAQVQAPGGAVCTRPQDGAAPGPGATGSGVVPALSFLLANKPALPCQLITLGGASQPLPAPVAGLAPACVQERLSNLPARCGSSMAGQPAGSPAAASWQQRGALQSLTTVLGAQGQRQAKAKRPPPRDRSAVTPMPKPRARTRPAAQQHHHLQQQLRGPRQQPAVSEPAASGSAQDAAEAAGTSHALQQDSDADAESGSDQSAAQPGAGASAPASRRPARQAAQARPAGAMQSDRRSARQASRQARASASEPESGSDASDGPSHSRPRWPTESGLPTEESDGSPPSKVGRVRVHAVWQAGGCTCWRNLPAASQPSSWCAGRMPGRL